MTKVISLLAVIVIWTILSVGCVSTPEYVDQNVSIVIPNAVTSTDVLVNFNQTMRHVNGTETSSPILVFGLGGCPACKNTKSALDGYGIEYWWIDIDTLTPQMRAAMSSGAGMMGVCNDVPSEVPVIIKGTTCVVGYRADVIRAIAEDGE